MIPVLYNSNNNDSRRYMLRAIYVLVHMIRVHTGYYVLDM